MALYRIALIAFLSSLSCYSAVVISPGLFPAVAGLRAIANPLSDPAWKPGTVDYLEIPAAVGGNSRPVRSLAFTPDSQFLVSAGVDKTIKIWNVEARSLIRTLSPSPAQEVGTVALTAEGQTLASGSIDGTVRLWNWKTGQLLQTLTGHSSLVTSVAFSPNGQTLASGSGDKTIRLWNVNDGSLQRTITTQQFIETLAFSPTDDMLASAGIGMKVDLWNGSTGKLIRSLGRYTGVIYAIAFSPDGQSLAFSPDANADNPSLEQNTLRLWNLRGEQIGQPLKGHTDYIDAIAFSPTGQTLVSGSLDKTVKVWNVQTGMLIPGTAIQEYLKDDRRILAIAYRPDGKAFAVSSGDGSIKIFISRE
ncbi:MAG: WD40 repeat domain-containing protein [Leptolyngbyaceae cyanobacterium CSU_1_4]|nr:WD40 repeat domain-containing protein [Leptolyngbyaceae cyanobacterium CSU_1_4]